MKVMENPKNEMAEMWSQREGTEYILQKSIIKVKKRPAKKVSYILWDHQHILKNLLESEPASDLSKISFFHLISHKKGKWVVGVKP